MRCTVTLRKDLPLIKGETICRYFDEDGKRYCEVCGKIYPSVQIVHTYGAIDNNELPKEYAHLDLAGDETNKINYSPERIDRFDVYDVYFLLEDVYIDPYNCDMSPIGRVVGARQLVGAEKKSVYGVLNYKSREVANVLKHYVMMRQEKDTESLVAENSLKDGDEK